MIPPSSIPEINSDRIRVIIEAMSPWEGQELYLITDDLVREIPLKKDVFDAYEIEVGSDMLAKRIYLGVSMIHSPKSYGISTDARRLGAAIKSIRLDGGLP